MGDRSPHRTRQPPTRILGLDFSGAALAGRGIWLAEGRRERRGLRVTALRRGDALPCSAAARAICLKALDVHLADLGYYAIGMDFPFSLHQSLVKTGSLPDFIAAFPGRFADPEAFRAFCRAAGSERELKRRCDLEARTPFAPHNLRVYRQTWHGIAEVLRPLLASGARILPVQRPWGKAPWLLEACPASALKRAGMYAPYKGSAPAHRSRRENILAYLLQAGVILDPAVPAAIVLDNPGGDALDALLCAWIAWRAINDPGRLFPELSPAQRLEGWVYY